MSDLPQLGDKGFETLEAILEGDQTILLDFYADWCVPCRSLTPILTELHKERGEKKYKIVKIDIETPAGQELAEKFEITSIPTLLRFKNNKKTHQIVGLQNKAVLKAHLE